MNGSISKNRSLLTEVISGLPSNLGCDVLVCAPAPYLLQCEGILNGTAIQLGAQDVSMHSNGAYTGEISATMLSDCGCAYVIIGHSERRAYHSETDVIVAQKVLKVLEAGLTPIVCVGETLEQRETGQTNMIVAAQLQAVLDVVDIDRLDKLVIAYEPVWAIGTGKTATPQMAQDVHEFLRGQIALNDEMVSRKVRIIYGGSMKPENAGELLAMKDIDGGLIGVAALMSVDFLKIIAAAR